MKMFRKTISVIMCLLLIISVFAVSAGALSISSGLAQLRNQWQRGVGPSAGGFTIDYSYYSPSADGDEAEDGTYPLFVFMAGAGEGEEAGAELEGNSFAYWSSSEFQAKVAYSGGAYLMILRSPDPIYFNVIPAASTFAAVSDFVDNHPSVDKSRIFAFGWCFGAAGAAKLVLTYPDYFAGLAFISPNYTISASEAEKLADKRVWCFGCTKDTFSFYNTFTKASFDNIVAVAKDKSNVRLTSCSSAPNAALLINHQLWALCEQDYSTSAQTKYKDLVTVDGNGNTVEKPEVISWFTSFSNTQTSAHEHSYSEKITPATLTEDGTVMSYCTGCGSIRSTAKIYHPVSFQTEYKSYTLRDEPVMPNIIVKDVQGRKLSEDKDYYVGYSENNEIGEGKAIITFRGCYSGTTTITFPIVGHGTDPSPDLTPEGTETLSFYLGDVDSDGAVTVSDARIILRVSIGLEELKGALLIVANTDRDVEYAITVADARLALRTAIGLREPKLYTIEYKPTIE